MCSLTISVFPKTNIYLILTHAGGFNIQYEVWVKFDSEQPRYIKIWIIFTPV